MSWERKDLTSSPKLGDEIAAVNNESDGEDEFEFAVAAPTDNPADSAADEIFSGGRMLPVYPVFNRSLLLDPDPRNAIADPVKLRSGSTSSTSSEEADGLPAEKFGVWNPSSAPQSPDRCKKSSSIGSGASSGLSKRWKLRDLMSRRSRSDGKEKLSHVDLEKVRSPKPNPNLKKEGEKEKKKPKEMDLITAHRLFYGKESTAKGGRPYLPHRSGPVGLFANGNGLSRATFPF